ncbi:MAG: DUF3488 domain-containing protein, partial [Bifidobacteriaceae bacterium]|nr:DUF3488 domain-containing protein [Bifidobacteriaceae bacterium]
MTGRRRGPVAVAVPPSARPTPPAGERDRFGATGAGNVVRRSRPGALAVAVVFYLTLAAPIMPLIRGGEWIGWYVGFGLMVFAVGLIGRLLNLANGLIGLIEAAIIPPALIAAFAADLAWAWIIPNARVWDRFSDLANDLGKAFLLETSPLTAGRWIFAFIALSGAVLAWVFDWYVFTVRAPAATGLFAALVGVVAVVFVRQGLPLMTFAPMALAYLTLLAVTARDARPRLAAPGIVAGSVALGLIAGQMTPGLGIGGLVHGRDRGGVRVDGDSPLLDLGDDLRASPSTEALRYRSPAGPVYLRLTTLSQFDGTDWRHLPGEQPVYSGEGEAARPLPGADVTTVGLAATIEVEIVDLDSDWLPAPYQPTALSGFGGALGVDQGDLTLSLVDGGTEDQVYSVAVGLPNPGSVAARAWSGQQVGPAQAEA